MDFIHDNIHWIMIGAGVLTLTMLMGVFAPRRTLQGYFGAASEDPGVLLLVRNWSALVALGGAFLIAAAHDPALQSAAMMFVGTGKLVFIALVVSHGGRFLKTQAGLAVVLDAIIVALFAAHLISSAL